MHFCLSKQLLLAFNLLVGILAALSSGQSHSCLSGHKRKDSKGQTEIFQDVNTTTDATKFKHLLFKSLNSVSGTAKKIQKRIEKQHLKTRQLKKECKNDASSLPKVLEMISEDNVSKNLANVLTDFRLLTVMSQFVTTATLDNVANYQDDLSKLQKAFSDTLCYAELLADHYRVEAYQGFSDENMLTEFQNMTDQAIRDRRNCLFMREINKIVKKMKNPYK